MIARAGCRHELVVCTRYLELRWQQEIPYPVDKKFALLAVLALFAYIVKPFILALLVERVNIATYTLVPDTFDLFLLRQVIRSSVLL